MGNAVFIFKRHGEKKWGDPTIVHPPIDSQRMVQRISAYGHEFSLFHKASNPHGLDVDGVIVLPPDGGRTCYEQEVAEGTIRVFHRKGAHDKERR